MTWYWLDAVLMLVGVAIAARLLGRMASERAAAGAERLVWAVRGRLAARRVWAMINAAGGVHAFPSSRHRRPD